MIELFISHSSRDSELAGLLVRLFRNALSLDPEKIRCTSLNGYRLPAGADVGESLRTEVVNTKVLIGVISARSADSAYVLFELGARWGAKKPIFPLLAPGTSQEFIRGPIAGLNALRCDDQGQLHQLITDISKDLNINPFPPQVYQRDLDDITNYAMSLPAVPPIEETGGSIAEERKQLEPALRALLDVMKLNDYLVDNHTVLTDYQDFLAPFLAVASAAEQAIAGTEASDPRWLAIGARDRDLARRMTDNFTLFEHDMLWFQDADLRELPVVNIPKFVDALVHPDRKYSNKRMRDHLIACAKVATALGQTAELPASLPESFFLLDFFRIAGLDQGVMLIEELREEYSPRKISIATNELDAFCERCGVQDPGCSPERLIRLLGRKAEMVATS